MKTSYIYIGILLGVLSCTPQGFNPTSGDLLFQMNDPSAMTDAITTSTTSEGATKFSHVAIAVECNGADSVLEASSEGGVRMVSLENFLASSAKIGGQQGVVVMRLRDTSGIEASVRRARKLIGQPYDYSYRTNNGKQYCSELVWDSYLRPDGEHIFTAKPMNFRDTLGNLPLFWSKLFDQLGESVPEGELGTNPADMSKEKSLQQIHNYL